MKRFYILWENIWVAWPTKSVWGAFTVDCICFPGSLPLHHSEKLCRNCGKTQDAGWHPEDYETSLWSLCITRDLLKCGSLLARRLLIGSSNGHGHHIVPGPPACHSVSCSSMKGHKELFSLSPWEIQSGAAVPMATSPKSIHLIRALFSLPGSTRNCWKHLHRACFRSKNRAKCPAPLQSVTWNLKV